MPYTYTRQVVSEWAWEVSHLPDAASPLDEHHSILFVWCRGQGLDHAADRDGDKRIYLAADLDTWDWVYDLGDVPEVWDALESTLVERVCSYRGDGPYDLVTLPVYLTQPVAGRVRMTSVPVEGSRRVGSIIQRPHVFKRSAFTTDAESHPQLCELTISAFKQRLERELSEYTAYFNKDAWFVQVEHNGESAGCEVFYGSVQEAEEFADSMTRELISERGHRV
jgi:hypothetical protein